jgi:hypothetical protein
MKQTGLLATTVALAVLTLGAGRAGELVESRESWGAGTPRGWGNQTGSFVLQWTDEAADRSGLLGRFDRQGVSFPELDAFVAGPAASGGMFAGNYWTNGAPVRVAFDFLAANVLPSALWFQFVGTYAGQTNSYMRSLIDQVPAGGVWYRLEVPLSYDGPAWIGGGTGSDFTNALRNVRELSVRVVRSGTDEQRYLIDNFALVKDLSLAVATNDADGDGLPDYWEQAHFNNPTNAAPEADQDGDRMSNLAEYIADKDPWDRTSALWIYDLDWAGQQGLIGFNGALGRLYQVEGGGTVLTQEWGGVSGVVTGRGGYASLVVTNAAARQYFRLQVRKP